MKPAYQTGYGAILIRLCYSLFALWLVTLFFFSLTEMSDWDFAIATSTQFTTREDMIATRLRLGLYLDAPSRYLQWIGAALSGDLGESWWLRTPVLDLVLDRLARSSWLVMWGVIVAVPAALALASLRFSFSSLRQFLYCSKKDAQADRF